jgi:uncharacterized membrane protein
LISLVLGGYLKTPPTPGSLIIISLLPLIIFLPGMARENSKSLAMLCFVALMYFIPIVDNIMSPTRSPADFVTLTFICILFFAAMLFSRWKQYALAGNP